MSYSVVTISLWIILYSPVKGNFEDSTIYIYQPPSNGSGIQITPSIPNNNFKSSAIEQEIDVPSHFYSRFYTYIFPIAGTGSHNNTTIVALQYCARERQSQRGNFRSHFDFFTLEPATGTSEPVHQVAYSVTASSVLTVSNCTNIRSRSTMVCCSYQRLLNSQLNSGASHFGITNIREYPTLLSIPNTYKTPFYYRSGSITVNEGDVLDLRALLKLDDGPVPSLRLYYDAPILNDEVPMTESITDITTATLQETHNLSTDPPDFNPRQIFLTAGLAAGGGLLVLLFTVIIAIILVSLSRRKKDHMKYEGSSPSDKNIYNTLNVVRPIVTDGRYSVLEPEWLLNNAYQSHLLGEDETRRENVFPRESDREEPLLQAPYNLAGQGNRKMPNRSSYYSTVATRPSADYSTIKKIQPHRNEEIPLQPNSAYAKSEMDSPVYVNIKDVWRPKTSETPT